jgi:hypothetical protein
MSKLRYFPNSSLCFSAFANKKTNLRYFFTFFCTVNIEAVCFIFENKTAELKQFGFASQKFFFLTIWFVTFSILGSPGQKILFRFAKRYISLFCDSFRFWSWEVLVKKFCFASLNLFFPFSASFRFRSWGVPVKAYSFRFDFAIFTIVKCSFRFVSMLMMC